MEFKTQACKYLGTSKEKFARLLITLGDRIRGTDAPALLLERLNNAQEHGGLVKIITEVLRKLHAPVIRVGKEGKPHGLLSRVGGSGSRQGKLVLHGAHRILTELRAHDGDHGRVEGAGNAEVRHFYVETGGWWGIEANPGRGESKVQIFRYVAMQL